MFFIVPGGKFVSNAGTCSCLRVEIHTVADTWLYIHVHSQDPTCNDIELVIFQNVWWLMDSKFAGVAS